MDNLTFTFVTDGIEVLSVSQSRRDDKDVNIIGAASTAQQCLKTDCR
jgi:dihydrofolate reductase